MHLLFLLVTVPTQCQNHLFRLLYGVLQKLAFLFENSSPEPLPSEQRGEASDDGVGESFGERGRKRARRPFLVGLSFEDGGVSQDFVFFLNVSSSILLLLWLFFSFVERKFN